MRNRESAFSERLSAGRNQPQAELGGFHIPVCYQLLSLEVCRVFSQRSTAQLMAAVTEGLITWAFDIRCATKSGSGGMSRPCVRVLRASLLRYVRGDFPAVRTRRMDARADERELIDAVNIMFPQHQTAVASSLIDEAFLCSANHRQYLLKEQSLRCVIRNTRTYDWKKGPGGMGLITRESVLEFLKARRIT